MKRTVFYSWQSDLNSHDNRNLIEDALNRALKGIRKDESETVEPVLDRDTAGLSGTPSISESIFAKISLADVFVADISIVNQGKDKRLTPNPNVLIELGFAIAQLGWERILLVQNIAYGAPEELPFDLRGRRIVPYSFKSGTDDKSEVRGLLQGRLEAALKSALSNSSQTSLPTGKDAQLWWGKWSTDTNGLSYGGNLFIYDVGAVGFLFDISVFNGSHSGMLTAYAKLVSPNLAYARVTNGDDGEFGEILFRRDINQGRRVITVEETASCSYYRGMGAFFAGSFVRIQESLFNFGVLNELELQRLYNITGEFYDSLMLRFQGLSEAENLDTFSADVVTGGVRGMYTSMEGIIMRGQYGELWVAYIDDDVVRYFTTQTEWKEIIPKTIEDWKSRFQEKSVIFHPCVDIIPKTNL